MSSVTLQGVSKSYGTVTALRTMDLEIAEGEFLTLLGPSGCGKTTTLRLVAGSFHSTRSSRRAASSVPSHTITMPECCEKPIPTPPP